IRQTVEEAGLTGIQLHGDEDVDFLRDLRNSINKKRVLKAVRAREGFEAELADFAGDGSPDLFLLDSGSPDARGGTGRRFDWEQHAGLIRLAARQYRLIIAGGLNPENVADAVAEFRPFGVDVVSGVEREPGKKDHTKLKAFVSAAK